MVTLFVGCSVSMIALCVGLKGVEFYLFTSITLMCLLTSPMELQHKIYKHLIEGVYLCDKDVYLKKLLRRGRCCVV